MQLTSQPRTLAETQQKKGGNASKKRPRPSSDRKMSEQQKIDRRERNREHAKRSRIRKKFLLESLHQSVENLKEEVRRASTEKSSPKSQEEWFPNKTLCRFSSICHFVTSYVHPYIHRFCRMHVSKEPSVTTWGWEKGKH